MGQRRDFIDETKGLVVQALRLDIDPGELSEDEPLFGDGYGIDSIAALEIVAAMEQEFSLVVSDEDLVVELFESVRSLAGYIQKKTQESAGVQEDL